MVGILLNLILKIDSFMVDIVKFSRKKLYGTLLKAAPKIGDFLVRFFKICPLKIA